MLSGIGKLKRRSPEVQPDNFSRGLHETSRAKMAVPDRHDIVKWSSKQYEICTVQAINGRRARRRVHEVSSPLLFILLRALLQSRRMVRSVERRLSKSSGFHFLGHA